jgi:hypothetical protein
MSGEAQVRVQSRRPGDRRGEIHTPRQSMKRLSPDLPRAFATDLVTANAHRARTPSISNAQITGGALLAGYRSKSQRVSGPRRREMTRCEATSTMQARLSNSTAMVVTV